MDKFIAEVIGTFALLFFAITTIAFFQNAGVPTNVGILGIAFAFGLTVTAMAHGIGPISGAHLNPAVSLGAMLAGRINTATMINYWIAQFIGATLATIVVYFVLGGTAGAGSNVPHVGAFPSLVFEFIATFFFVLVILGATQNGSPTSTAGLVIGLTLTLIHIAGIPLTEVGVNPARSFATNIFGGGQAIADLWIYFVGPLGGAALAGILYKAGVTRASDDK